MKEEGGRVGRSVLSSKPVEVGKEYDVQARDKSKGRSNCPTGFCYLYQEWKSRRKSES